MAIPTTTLNRLTLIRILPAMAFAVTMATLVAFGSPEKSADVPVSDAELQMAKANNQFGFKLYQQLAKENTGSNVFFSPYSISSAFMMAASGAVDETAKEMKDVLCLPQPVSEMQQAMALLSKRLQNDETKDTAGLRTVIAELQQQLKSIQDKRKTLTDIRDILKLEEKERSLRTNLHAAATQVDQYELSIANAIWGEKSYPFNQDYIQQLNRRYSTGGLLPVDFRGNSKRVRLQINEWVENHTNNRIKNLLPAGSVNWATRMVLVNAVYFRGDWSVPFRKSRTKDGTFYLTGGATKKTPLMSILSHNEARYAAFNADGSRFSTPRRISLGQTDGLYPEDGGFSIVELPYKGGEISMVLIAPLKKDGLPEIEALMNAELFTGWMKQMHRRDTNVTMPKLRLEAEYSLGSSGPRGTLPEMGMKRAFTSSGAANGAQLDRMTTSTNPDDQLHLGSAIHKAFLEVDEKGTEAAAATAIVGVGPTSVAITKPFTPSFVADRPFLTIIRDNSTGAILFMGRIEEP